MLAFKLAFRNLIGAGLRTWLNVGVLSFAYVVIIFYNGILDGWYEQAIGDSKDWAFGTGQLWHPSYDPFDIFSLQDSHAPITNDMQSLIDSGKISPILITQASIYPKGRMQNIIMKGIDIDQKILKIPTGSLQIELNEIPVIIGKRMAIATKLKKGDLVLVRWRDKNGTFDAKEAKVVDIFDSNVPSIDNNQIWIPIKKMQEMMSMINEASIFVVSKNYVGGNIERWQLKDLKFLLRDIENTVQSKKSGSVILYGLLLAIALLSIFDTQVLSIFRRQKEIGTYIALGMTRAQVVKIFTVEGGTYSLLAAICGAIYGIPLLSYINNVGIPMAKGVDDFGISIAEKIFPVYSIGLVLATTLLVVISATIISYFPARKILKMKPTDALKGKMQ